MLRDDEAPKRFESRFAVELRDSVLNVRPVEAGDELTCVLEPQLREDFGSGARVGRCRERDARHLRKALGQCPELAILGPEIMTPLRNAMCLVDGKQGDAAAGQQAQRPFLEQTFRCDIDEIERA